MTPEELSDKLADFLQRSHDARSVRIEGLRLLTGGAGYHVILRSGAHR